VGTIKTLIKIRKEKFDVVHWQHFNTLPPVETFMAKSLRWLSQFIVITVHDVDPWSMVKGKSDFLLRTTYQSANCIVVHHEANRLAIAKNYLIPENRIRVVPHGSYVEFEKELPGKELSRRELGIPDDGPVLLFFGEIRPEKGLIHLIRSMKLVISAIAGVRLVIAGRPRHMDMTECQREIQSSGSSEAIVTRFEYIDDSLVAKYFAMSDVIVLPYLAITQSGVLFEAMTAGRPVVVTDTGAMGPTVREAKIGLVVEPADEVGLARSIIEILENPDLAKAMSENGRKAAEEQFSWSNCAKQTVLIYNEFKP
jgi:glycosyltransferase involved in cell wall biosynthesis